MKCPYCKSEQIKVIGRRNDPYCPKDIKIRYRKCLDCGRRFKTTEEYTDKTKREVELWKKSMNC